jgi:hypothetical protein
MITLFLVVDIFDAAKLQGNNTFGNILPEKDDTHFLESMCGCWVDEL